MSFISILAKLAKGVGKGATSSVPGGALVSDAIGAAGSALGAGSQASADNRGSQLEAAALQERLNRERQAQYVDQQLARQAEGRASGSDAWRKMQQAEYLGSASGYTPKSGLSSYGFGPKAPTDAEKRGAAAFSAEAMKRLEGGNPIPEVQNPGSFQFDPKLLKGSTAENLAGILGASLGAYGNLADDEAGQATVMEALRRLGIVPFNEARK